jgi:uncharacterized membrane protein YkvA (DUF1232 family)
MTSLTRIPGLVWRLLWDRRVPMRTKIWVPLALVYFALPVEIIPERLLGPIGYLDDIILLVLSIVWMVSRAPEEAVEGARNMADSREKRGTRTP